MKKTINRKTTLRQKITAVILSAVTACSVGTMAFTTTAFAADNGADLSLGLDITDTLKVTMDKDLLTAVNITSGVIFKVLEECTPWGKFVTPAFFTAQSRIIRQYRSSIRLDKAVEHGIKVKSYLSACSAVSVLEYHGFHLTGILALCLIYVKILASDSFELQADKHIRRILNSTAFLERLH